MNVLRKPLLLTCLFGLLLTGCGSSTSENPAPAPGESAPPTEAFSVALGTLNYEGGPGLSVLYKLDADALPREEMRVDISGPEAWSDEDATMTFQVNPWVWRNVTKVGGERRRPQSGTYTFTASLSGKEYEATARLEESALAPLPTGFTASQLGTSRVKVEWEDVGAASYFAEVYTGDDTLPRGTIKGYTTDTQITLPDVPLVPGETYYVSLQTFPVDFTSEPVELPEGNFDSAYLTTSFTAIAIE